MDLRSGKDPARPTSEAAGASASDRSWASALRRLGGIKLGTAWMLITILGALLIYLAPKGIKEITIGVPLGLLVIYALYGHSIPQKNTIKFADSMYFMGFLWTLFALIIAFVVRPLDQLTASTVLTAYGYALITTCAGMFLRLLVLQFQETLPDRLADAEEEIDKRVAALTEQMQKATAELVTYRQEATDVLTNRLDSLSRSLHAIETAITEGHRHLAETAIQQLDEALRAVVLRLQQIEVPHEKVKAEVTKLAQQLGKWGEKLERLMPTLEEKMLRSAEQIDQLAKSLFDTDGAKHVQESFQRLRDTLTESTTQVGATTGAWLQASGGVDKTVGSMVAFKESINHLGAALQEVEAQLRNFTQISADDLRNRFIDVQQAIDTNLKTSQQIESAMHEVVEFLSNRVLEERGRDAT